MEGGHEVSQAAYLAYESSRPVTGTASKGAALFRKKAAAEARKRIKKVEAGKKLAKRTAKKAAKDTAKTVAKETAKETAKTTAKVATKTATKAAATAAGTAVAPGVGTAIGMAAGYAAGVSIEVKDENMTTEEIWKQLDDKVFAHIHVSYIINLGHIRAIDGDEVVMDNEERLLIARSHKQNLKEKHMPR